MPNQEQLAILLEAPGTWNHWRDAHSTARIDLVTADLTGANLFEANLSGADLTKATLAGADLRKAKLQRTTLSAADLTKANFRKAYLSGADLRGATLKEAVLHHADLARAILSAADLTNAFIRKAYLSRADLTRADLKGANLQEADLEEAKLQEANLTGADLTRANLAGADLTTANLTGANLTGASLSQANLTGANLTGANLTEAVLVASNLQNAVLTGCRVYGISAWDLQLKETIQNGLVITRQGDAITVDNLAVAQFMYLLLNNQAIRDVIDTITSKVVLILGRFTPERKILLDALRDRLRARNYSPVVFDFEKPASRDLTETIRILGGLARFVVADITDAKSIPHELMAIVPFLPSVAVQPLLLEDQREYAMFPHFQRYPWVLKEVMYDDVEKLVSNLETLVITPAEAKVRELRPEAQEGANR